MYKQPFAITYLGVSLMVIYLPIAYLKDCICNTLDINLLKRLCGGRATPDFGSGSSAGLDIPLRINEFNCSPEADFRSSDEHLSEREEGWPLLLKSEEDETRLIGKSRNLNAWETAKCSLVLAPLWFMTEVTNIITHIKIIQIVVSC